MLATEIREGGDADDAAQGSRVGRFRRVRHGLRSLSRRAIDNRCDVRPTGRASDSRKNTKKKQLRGQMYPRVCSNGFSFLGLRLQ